MILFCHTKYALNISYRDHNAQFRPEPSPRHVCSTLERTRHADCDTEASFILNSILYVTGYIALSMFLLDLGQCQENRIFGDYFNEFKSSDANSCCHLGKSLTGGFCEGGKRDRTPRRTGHGTDPPPPDIPVLKLN